MMMAKSDKSDFLSLSLSLFFGTCVNGVVWNEKIRIGKV